jgi:hypothetical protein
VADAEDELVVLQDLWPEFEVAIDRIFQRKAIRFAPGNEWLLPVVELRRRRPIERDAMPLQFGPCVKAIETVPAPVVVSVVSVGESCKRILLVFPGSAARTTKNASLAAVRRPRCSN